MTTSPAAALLLLACGGDDAIGAREADTTARALQAIQLAALGAEIAAPARLDPPAGATTCPTVSSVGGYTTSQWGACLPERGWVRAPMDGQLRLDLRADTASTDIDGLGVGVATADGDLDTDLAAGGAIAFVLDLEGAADVLGGRAEVSASLSDGLVLDGTVTLDLGGQSLEVLLTGVQVPNASGCFVPTGGSVDLEQGLTDVNVVFGKDGLGQVSTSLGDSGAVDLCGLDSNLFGG